MFDSRTRDVYHLEAWSPPSSCGESRTSNARSLS
jgi:hypothetical protein